MRVIQYLNGSYPNLVCVLLQTITHWKKNLNGLCVGQTHDHCTTSCDTRVAVVDLTNPSPTKILFFKKNSVATLRLSLPCFVFFGRKKKRKFSFA